MKLSICIPIYNFDVRQLVGDLAHQMSNLPYEIEIVLIDDGSTNDFNILNQQIESKVAQFVFLPKNIGRSKIRNLFLEYVAGDYLLFLDCDGKLLTDDFLKSYIESIIKVNPDVIYGGRVVAKEKPSDDYLLRWNFSQQRENLPLKKRLFVPYLSFQTNNFVVKKSIFEQFQFNENLNQYGYEDLLFAMDLKQAHVPIFHLDNPILNDDVETNVIFIEKSRQAAESLSKILSDKNSSFKVNDLKLSRAYLFLKKYKLIFIFRLFFNMMQGLIVKQLKRGDVSLRYLDIFKLGTLINSLR